ncbi:MAG: LVIVD repeat-containing protein [Candidatus Hodarchaeota archaeon]
MRKLTIIIVLIILELNLGYLTLGSSGTSEPQLILTEISTIHTGSRTTDVYVNADVLYALDSSYGLQIYNICNPNTPEKLGSFYDYYTFAHRLCYNNELIFIADYEDKLEIVNVSDPTTPQLISHYQERNSSVQWSSSTHLEVVNDLVYLASQEEGLEIINISNLTQPVKISSYFDEKSVIVISATKDLAFIGESGGHGLGGGFQILNTSNPACPVKIYQCDEVNVGIELFVLDNLLYVPDEDFGLRIYDISDPPNAVKVGERQIDGKCLNCVIEDRGAHTYAFLAAWDVGTFILDVTDPNNPLELAQYNDGGEAVSLFFQNDLVFIAERDYGLEILRIEGLEEKTPTTSSSELSSISTSIETTIIPSFELHFVILTLFLLLTLRTKNRGKN